MASPTQFLNGWIGLYAAKTLGMRGYGSSCTVLLDNDNEPQPDVILLFPTHLDGPAFVDADDFITGPPTLVCEIAASSSSIELHAKKAAYRRNGVQEYLVWRTEDHAIDWFALVEGDFLPISPENDSTLRSRAFPGLWLRPSEVLAADLPAMIATLDAGAATAEHSDFVGKLKI